MKLALDRKRWLRGNVPQFLLDNDGMSCPLGALGRAVGIPLLELKMHTRPGTVSQQWRRMWPATVLPSGSRTESAAAMDLMYANLDPGLSEAQREREVIRLFAAMGIQAQFV